MSTSFIWLCVILTLVSAFVAYLGDLLGRHVGKRKIQLFGLRPRDSAIVVTSVTGGLITLITILVLLWGNASINRMAKSADEVIRLQTEARTKIADAESSIRLISDRMQSLQSQLSTLESDMQKTTAERDTLQNEIKTLDLTVAEQREKATRLEAEAERLERKRAQQSKEISANTAYIVEQERALASLHLQTEQLTKSVEAYREGDIILAEGTALAGDYLSTSGTDSELRTRIENLRADITLPAGLKLGPLPASAVAAAVQAVRGRDFEPLAVVICEAEENVLDGGTVVLSLRVLPYVEVFRKGDRILIWRLDRQLNRVEADRAAQTILPQISQKAIARGAIPMMGDLGVTRLNSLNSARLIADLEETEAPAYFVFEATDEIRALDFLVADVNFTWRIVESSVPLSALP